MKARRAMQDKKNQQPQPAVLKDAERRVKAELTAYDKLVKKNEAARQEEETRKKFADLVKSTTELGRSLSTYAFKPYIGKTREWKDQSADSWRLYFSGFLEGDFAEQAHFPISLFGGFLLKTPYGNILFDPGTGTRAGLRDMGVDISTETDVIVVSHYHFSVRYDLHLTLNEMGAFRPDSGGREADRKIPFLSTEAVIKGRNKHPEIITPPYLRVIEPRVVKPGAVLRISKGSNGCVVEECGEGGAAPDKKSLLLMTFPSYHDEVSCPGEVHDEAAYNGGEVSSYFITDGRLKVFFTGDTEFKEEAFKKNLLPLKKGVDVLIANMKTIEFLHEGSRGEDPIDPDRLFLTRNQLGFEGVKRLAQFLRPRKLVTRALGLECVVELNKDKTRLDYAPEKLGVYQRYLHHLLTTGRNRTRMKEIDDIVIPIRHELRVKPLPGGAPEITHDFSISAVPYVDVLTLGDGFVTGNKVLIERIIFYMHLLETHERPFIVIEGESGSGKSFLAESIAYEILKKRYPEDGDTSIKSKIREHDLALQTENDVNRFLVELVGSVPGWFPGHRGGPGMLSVDNGILILNQFERLHSSLAKTFLDILQQWRYTKLGESTPRPVEVKIIFTTNKQLDTQENLSPDLKNRVRGRLMTIPSLKRLSQKEREDTISLFISKYCERRRVQLDSPSWGLLLKADLKDGAIRCLEGLLEKARFLAEEKHGIYKIAEQNRPIVFISAEDVGHAMEENGVSLMGASSGGEKPSKQAAWVVAVWVSHGCTDSKTYHEMSAGAGKSPAYFKKRLAGFRRHFDTPGEAWAFLSEPGAVEALGKKGLDAYVNLLDASDGRADAAALFTRGNDRQWQEERRSALLDALKDRKVTETFLKKFGD